MGAIGAAGCNHRHPSAFLAVKTAQQIPGCPPHRTVIKPDIGRVRHPRNVGNHRDHMLSGILKFGHGFAHQRMINRHKGNAICLFAMLAECLGQKLRIETVDEKALCADVIARRCLGRGLDPVAQQLQIRVRARRQQKHHAHRFGPEHFGHVIFGQIAKFACGLQNPFCRAFTHPRTFVQNAVHRCR